MSYVKMVKAALAQRRQSEAATASEHAPQAAEWSRLLGLPLDVFERQESIIEIRVSFFILTLYFVSGEKEVERLSKEGVSRGRIWTARELIDLLSVHSLTRADIATIAHAKAFTGGDLVTIKRRELSEESGISPWSDATKEAPRELSEESEGSGAGS